MVPITMVAVPVVVIAAGLTIAVIPGVVPMVTVHAPITVVMAVAVRAVAVVAVAGIRLR